MAWTRKRRGGLSATPPGVISVPTSTYCPVGFARIISEAVPISKEVAELIFGRLGNFFHRATPWTRALWGIGTPLGLEEVVEYADVARQANESNAGLIYSATALTSRVRRDPGLGTGGVSDAASTLLEEFAGLKDGKSYPAPDAVDRLRELALRVRRGYLTNWLSALGNSEPEAEFAARCIAGFMLDEGFSGDFLHRQLPKEGSFDLDALRDYITRIDEAHAAGVSRFEILVPYRRMPGLHQATGALGPAAAAAAIKQEGHESPDGLAGALVVEVEAFDAWGAVAQAAVIAGRVGSRVVVGRKDSARPEPFDDVFVKGQRQTFRLDQPRRTVELSNLKMRMYVPSTEIAMSGFDDAVDLVASFETKSPGAAITGGWAAIEALLSRPGEPDVGAADRAAQIVAAS